MKAPVSSLIHNVGNVLIVPALISLLCLYLYPVLLGCQFPNPRSQDAASTTTKNHSFSNIAPFRLLIFADPQLEGDSSLPDPKDPTFPNLYWFWTGNYSHDATFSTTLRRTIAGFVTEDVPTLLHSYQKRLDLFGNDYYLAHIYRTLDWWLKPTHVTVLGDLIGSQWVSHEEFDRRGRRFWDRVFKRGKRVEDTITSDSSQTETLGEDPAWSRRLINIAGNHDIGYAGDINFGRITRFERVFGKANWVRSFLLPNHSITSAPADSGPLTPTPELRLVMMNSMNLDGPVRDFTLQGSTYSFINNDVIINSKPPGTLTTFTILLTHIPLHKKAGICADAPFVAYSPYGISEQNHLSPDSSRNILEGIYGMSSNTDAPAGGKGRPGLILNGHDHVGCDVYHYLDREGISIASAENSTIEPWAVLPYSSTGWVKDDVTRPVIREITVRSMMGSFGGNAGMLSAWFDETIGEWRFEYDSCSLGVQHIWWGVHVLALVTLGCYVAAFVVGMFGSVNMSKRKSRISGSEVQVQHVKSE